jgi:hypothetical protein
MDSALKAVLFVRVPAVPAAIDAQWNAWYDQVHIEYRMRMPGFHSARRYRVEEGPQRCFVLYELASVGALTTPEYIEHRRWEYAQPTTAFEAVGPNLPGFERGVYEKRGGAQAPSTALDAPEVFVAGHDPAPDGEKSFEEWFDGVHQPQMLGVPGVRAVRRFRMTRTPLTAKSGLRTESPQHLAAYYVDVGTADQVTFRREVLSSWERSRRGDAPVFEMLGTCIYTTHAKAQQKSTP